MKLNAAQEAAVAGSGTLFLHGPAGSGKTTALRSRLLRLLQAGEPAYTLLMLVAELPQRGDVLAGLHSADIGAYSDLQVITYPSLARDMVTLFWPLVARPAGFARPYQPPTVLSYDMAQLLMWGEVDRALEGGAFADLRLRPQQIVSQVLDTLNRAALNRLTLTGAVERQISTWTGEPDHLRHLRQVETTARAFRTICLQNNLLEMSLVTEVFDRHLVEHPEFSRYFSERFRHLLVDNVEEQTPAGHHFIATLLEATQSTTLVFDEGGGYKRFLSADPANGRALGDACRTRLPFTTSFVAPAPVQALGHLVSRYLVGETGPSEQAETALLAHITGRYRRDMIANLVAYLSELLEDGSVAPGEVALIAPYLDGALHYSLTQALQEAAIPYFVLRRRSSPREEPRIRAWLTWLALAHPDWGEFPSTYDVAEALALSIEGLDPARAALLAEHLYDPGGPALLDDDVLPETARARIGEEMIALTGRLRAWLLENGGAGPADTFLYRLFNELLSQPAFRAETDIAGAAICDWLVRTAGRLRDAGPAIGLITDAAVGKALITGINQGLVTANPPDLGDPPDPDGVMISTAYGFLLAEHPVHVQVWLETAATGWWDIPRQPLNNVFVQAASWPPQRLWTAEEEVRVRNQLLSQVIRGLTARCTGGVILANSDLDRRGQQQDGALWRALQAVLPLDAP